MAKTLILDCGARHLEQFRARGLHTEELNAYNHMALYLRWCLERHLLSQEFFAKYAKQLKGNKTTPVDLREFIREELDGQLSTDLLSPKGRMFSLCYYQENSAPSYLEDIRCCAREVLGLEQAESSLFLPCHEDCYQAMVPVMDRHLSCWRKQQLDPATVEPSPLAQRMMDALDCPCTYFPSMRNDDPIQSAYRYAQRDSGQGGYIPMLVQVDERLWEHLAGHGAPESRQDLLAAPIPDETPDLLSLMAERQEEAEEAGVDWKKEVLGRMVGGFVNDCFSSYWNEITKMTCPLILARLPVKHPWEVFAYLPFGGWNDCPSAPELMAVAKYWNTRHGAVPAVVTHDGLECTLPAPVPKEKAKAAALEQFGFCPDLEQIFHKVGPLADTLRKSTVWRFWWD